MAVLNDSTGTLMSCAHKKHDCKIGVIIGKKGWRKIKDRNSVNDFLKLHVTRSFCKCYESFLTFLICLMFDARNLLTLSFVNFIAHIIECPLYIERKEFLKIITNTQGYATDDLF